MAITTLDEWRFSDVAERKEVHCINNLLKLFFLLSGRWYDTPEKLWGRSQLTRWKLQVWCWTTLFETHSSSAENQVFPPFWFRASCATEKAAKISLNVSINASIDEAVRLGPFLSTNTLPLILRPNLSFLPRTSAPSILSILPQQNTTASCPNSIHQTLINLELPFRTLKDCTLLRIVVNLKVDDSTFSPSPWSFT